jgi:hypothetical protein
MAVAVVLAVQEQTLAEAEVVVQRGQEPMVVLQEATPLA